MKISLTIKNLEVSSKKLLEDDEVFRVEDFNFETEMSTEEFNKTVNLVHHGMDICIF